jgi:hypothetical protein
MNKKVLFIGSEIFFGTSVGGFRQDRWLKAFLENSFECEVVDYASLFPKRYSASSWIEYYNFRKKIKESVFTKPSIKQGNIITVLRFLKHFFLFEVFNPKIYFQIIYLFNIYRNKKFDYVFTSSPPFTSNIIGFFLKKLGIADKMIVDFRDEWADSLFLPKLTMINRKAVEKIIVRNSEYILTVSEYSKQNLVRLYGNQNVKCVYNAPDINYNTAEKKEVDSEDQRNYIEFLYTGSMASGLFNCQKLFSFLSLLSAQENEKYKFKFVGAGRELQKIGELSNCFFLDQVQLNVSRKMQKETDILLFIGANFESNGGIVSSKIFEYIQSQKPILPLFVCKDSDVYFIIEKACGFCPTIHSFEDLHSLLSKLNHDNIDLFLPTLKNPDFLNQLLDAYSDFVKSKL